MDSLIEHSDSCENDRTPPACFLRNVNPGVGAMARPERKSVMVTSASSGIGRELCLDLAKAGCNIIAAARRMDQLKVLCNEINSPCKVNAVAVELDLSSDAPAIEVAISKAWQAFGGIDALVNNAGIRGDVVSLSYFKTMADASISAFLVQKLHYGK